MHEAIPDFVWRDLRPVLDEEINRLPNPFRQAFVLCQLEGKSNEQAARELGCPLGTLLSRLARARQRLRVRLTRRGITLAAGALALGLDHRVQARSVPGVWLEQTIRSALAFAAGHPSTTAAVSTQAVLLAEGVLKAMFLQRMRLLAGMVLLAGIIGTTAYSGQPGPEKGADPTFTKQEKLSGVSPNRVGSLADPDKESLRVANKLLQEEVEDQKDKLEALQKKLERLKKSGISLPREDEETAQLKRENRRLVTELRRLQEEVRLAQEDVQPYMQALEQRAGGRNLGNRWNSYETKK